MLDVMHTHGNEATRDLARNIMLLCGLNPVDGMYHDMYIIIVKAMIIKII